MTTARYMMWLEKPECFDSLFEERGCWPFTNLCRFPACTPSLLRGSEMETSGGSAELLGGWGLGKWGRFLPAHAPRCQHRTWEASSCLAVTWFLCRLAGPLHRHPKRTFECQAFVLSLLSLLLSLHVYQHPRPIRQPAGSCALGFKMAFLPIFFLIMEFA